MNYEAYAKMCDNYTEAKRQFDALEPDTHPKVTRRIMTEYWKYSHEVQAMEETLTGKEGIVK